MAISDRDPQESAPSTPASTFSLDRRKSLAPTAARELTNDPAKVRRSALVLEVGISVGAAAATFGLTWFAYFVVKGLEMLRLTGEFGELLGSVLPLLAVASVILPSLFLKGFSSVFRALPVAALVAAVGSIIVWQLSKS